jgi:hypothetical protein
MLVLIMIEDMLTDLGCKSVTSAATVDKALALINAQVFAVCKHYAIGDETGPLDESHLASAIETTAKLNADGFRIIAVVTKEMPPTQATYSVADEADLTLLGYIAFLDPPKETCAATIPARLHGLDREEDPDPGFGRIEIAVVEMFHQRRPNVSSSNWCWPEGFGLSPWARQKSTSHSPPSSSLASCVKPRDLITLNSGTGSNVARSRSP